MNWCDIDEKVLAFPVFSVVVCDETLTKQKKPKKTTFLGVAEGHLWESHN